MFTGLVKQVGSVTRVSVTPGGARMAVDLGGLAAGAEPGDSVCVSGACLTVAAKSGTTDEFDVVAETLSRTTLGELRPGDRVNLEPSLRVGDPLGGHFVLGHVDGVGSVTARVPLGEGARLSVAADPDLTSQMVPKGSVAVDGVSLTLAEVGAGSFTVALIPTTLRDTTLGLRKPGDRVNIETDVLGKFVARYLTAGRSRPADITLETLRNAGFA